MNEITWNVNNKIIPTMHHRIMTNDHYEADGKHTEHEEQEYIVYACGNCGAYVKEDKDNYCPKCGKEIDWGNG